LWQTVAQGAAHWRCACDAMLALHRACGAEEAARLEAGALSASWVLG
jgi:hypothetical protein